MLACRLGVNLFQNMFARKIDKEFEHIPKDKHVNFETVSKTCKNYNVYMLFVLGNR